jgi:hypothetical protein
MAMAICGVISAADSIFGMARARPGEHSIVEDGEKQP